MATEKIVMPQLGESVTEGTISKWLVEAGDTVKKYDPIAEVMTDKVNAEVPSSFTGTIKELVASEGDALEVGELVAYIEVEGEASKPSEQADSKHEKEVVETKLESVEQAEQPMKKRYSPAVLRLAQENDIDLDQVNGSGKGGRITRKDIQKLIDSGDVPKADSSQEKTPITAASQPASSQQPSVTTGQGDVEIPVSGVRKAIASNMVKSKHEAPHAWMVVEADVTNLVKYRNSVKEEFKQKEGYSLTFLPFFIKAVVESLKEYPQINSMWAGDKIIQKKAINISVAVATDDALFVPVLKDADEKSVKGLAKGVKELSTKVRNNQLAASDMEGGTFTVNNTGSFGSVMSSPIINHPQAAILSVESIVQRPVVKDGMIAVRDMVNLCLSLDHRALDGLICGRFLARVNERLENITKENTSIY
ncbi:MAG TPA: dihydrolipoamide acetyltransferase family protein [Bacillales bacterium]|nr:dihydrolipoamide acetyltransferase family protein [Bacillales bacterium]